MPTPHDIRRKALQALYALDVRGEADADAILATLCSEEADFPERDARRALSLATEAFHARAAADLAIREFAPEWPAHRQPAIDRAILRLAHHELATARAHHAIVINEAVELAKEFSTERSPPFVNAVLDRIHKSLAASAPRPTPDATPEPAPATPISPGERAADA